VRADRTRLEGARALMLAGTCLLLAACEAPIVYQTPLDRQAISASIASEKPGNYYVGYRFYKVDYHMWGWVKKPGEPWKDSLLVMMNEQGKLAPDRERHAIGTDNNTVYKLNGSFSGQKIYEPASDRFYPEFVLTGAAVMTTNPPLIFPDKRWTDPAVRLIGPPQF
jgi:hypothetical protein